MTDKKVNQKENKPSWQEEAERLSELYGISFVVFRNGMDPECADPKKVSIHFTDEGLGYKHKRVEGE